MDGNSSLERRYSFNMAQGNPVAESTHLNGSSFSWGSSMSPKHRSNSSICLNNTHTPSDCNKSIISPKSKNITKIDARIAADVQSKGLASRIVKYHESGTRLNRSMSAHNLYSKPGQFPVVTLKKTDLPYRATKQELSMIRIPPPEKSSFYGNTISSLLRSNSVVGIQSKRNEDLSRENRPIIHPPPTENDMAPTRSVLDVLKEISRKRINSDDLEADESSKKYCNSAGNDFVDTGNNTTSSIPQHFLASSMSCQRYKRQRDCITPHQSVQLSETKTSPEQAKKRVCNYNNDITSSLSSSIKCKPNGSVKRMSASCNLNQTMPTNLGTYETQKSKMQRYHDYQNNKTNAPVDVRFENLENTFKNTDNTVTPITPIPPTPCVQDQSNIGGVPPKRTVSEPIYNTDRAITMNSIQPASKPRLTLFNKKYDDDESSTINLIASAEENNDDSNDFGECAGIPFVKPKKLSSISGSRNPAIERTQKSKLALMLSGLRGELYQNSDADELDSSKVKPNKTDENKINSSNTSAVISALKTTCAITTLTTVTSSSNAGIPSTSSSLNLSTTTKTTSPLLSPSSASANKTSSPLVGLKLSQPKPLIANVNSTSSIDSTQSTEPNSKPNVPVLGGFSFGATPTSSALVINATTSNNVHKDSRTPTASIAAIPISSNNNSLNFGQPTQLTSTSSSSSDSNSNKLSANMQTSTKDNTLQFPAVGTAFTIVTTNTSTSNSQSSLTATNAFSFGTNATAPASTISSPNPVVGATPFNSIGKSNNAFNFTVPSTSSPMTTTSVTPIMFGSLTSSATPINTTSTSVVATTTTSALTFGAVTTSTNLSGLTTTPFTFNTPKQSSASEPTTISSSVSTVSTASFNFGSNLNAPSVPKFGTNTNAAIKTQPINSGFSFGSDTKIPNTSSGEQNNLTVAKQTDNNAFNPNPTTLFGSPSFNAPSTTGGPTPMFGNVTNSSEKNVFNSSNATSIFGSSSAKGGTHTFGSAADNKSAELPTPSVFGGGSTNGSTPTPFSFGSKPAIPQTTNTNNINAASGGFSFSSAVSNSSEGQTFGFGSKTSGPTNTSNNTFGVASASSIQNKNFTFGSGAANKPDNNANVFGGGANKPTENTASPGGFSFGSAMAPKASTFSFGAGNNSFSGSNVSSTNNSTSGFAFGGAAALKTNEVSTNKSFSFGSPQPPQQQQQQTMSAPNNSSNSSNIFGSSVASKTAPPPAFNFNTGSSTNLQSNAPATNNLFAPPPSTISTGPGDRPIRRATRRLQK